MLKALQLNIHKFLNEGHERSLRAKKNIIKSLVIKGGSVIISLMLIPLTINYVNPTQYGIWLTLSSLVTWAYLFDLGLGNGLKNKLTEAIALDDLASGRSYVSSTYAVLAVIGVTLFAAFCVVNRFINWQVILNAHGDSNAYLGYLVLLLFALFCCQFVVQLINVVITANQATARSSFLNMAGQLLTLVSIYLLSRFTSGSLTWLVAVFAGAPLLVLVIASLWYYSRDYRIIAPQFKSIKIKHAKKMLSVGGNFFIIGIAALFLYETDNIVVTQLFGPKEVTTFNIAYRLFSVILMFFVIVITPFWSAFTEAYTKNDYDWIKATISKMNKLWLLLSIGSVVLLVLSPWLYRLWIGNTVSVPVNLSVAMCIYSIAYVWQAIHVQLINGTGKIKLQFYLGIAAMFINVPLSIVLGKWLGLAGVTWSNTILFAIMGVFYAIQTSKIVNRTATGIFNA